MPRIEPAPAKGLFRRYVYRETRKRVGRDVEPVGIVAHHGALLAGMGAFETALARSKKVDDKLKSLAETKAALMVGCEFCIDIGSEYARRSGLSDEQLLALHDAHASGRFDDDQLLVIDLAAGMTRTPAVVDDALMECAVARFGTKGALELTHLIAWENTRARLNIALDIAPEGFSDGKVCALPAESAAPALAAARG